MSTWEAMALSAWNLKWWIAFAVTVATVTFWIERRSER